MSKWCEPWPLSNDTRRGPVLVGPSEIIHQFEARYLRIVTTFDPHYGLPKNIPLLRQDSHFKRSLRES